MIILELENGKKIEIELDEQNAPITCANFIELVNKGFYDGLIFHRVIKNFMIQGGDPTGTGMGGSEKNIKGEFKANGVNNTISHKRGVISMARAMDFNSASSQFFIVHKDATYLDGQYAAFGKVVNGIEVVDEIANVKTSPSDRPLEKVVIKKMYIK
ncbi:MAG: peptidylprolyl isomerase [Bacilli bacterium]|nr:peptidylprolyl isomerase [Bacilli bacterium]